MRDIQFSKVLLALLCVFLAVGFFIAGGFNSLYFIPAAGCLLAYFIIDKCFLRCPSCGAFHNLEQLFHAAFNSRHCWHCGEALKVRRRGRDE